MEYNNLGNSGLKISRLGLGTWINFSFKNDKKKLKKIVCDAFDNGVNFFDTADSYNFGESEMILGESLKEIKREQLVIGTKCFFPYFKAKNNTNLNGLSRKHIFESVNSSLKRLKIEYIDLLQFHRFDNFTPVDESIDAINDLIKVGKVLYYGVSKWNEKQIEDANNYCSKSNKYKLISNQELYNLFNQDLFYNQKRVYKKIGFIGYSPLSRGVLTNKYLNEKTPVKSRYNSKFKNTIYDYSKENLDKVSLIEEIAQSHNTKISAIVLNYSLLNKDISSLVIGCRTKSQLKENINCFNLKLNQFEIQKLNNLFTYEK